MCFIRWNRSVTWVLITSALLTLPGRVGEGEAAPLEMDAAVHQQLPEENRGVSGRPTWGILGRGLRGSSRWACFGPGHELNDWKPEHPFFLRPLLHLRRLFLRALRAQVIHGEQRTVRGRVVRSGLWEFWSEEHCSVCFSENLYMRFLLHGIRLWPVLIFQNPGEALAQSSLPHIWTKPVPAHVHSQRNGFKSPKRETAPLQKSMETPLYQESL